MYIFYHFYFSLSIRVTYGKTKFDSIGIGLEKIPGGELNAWQSRIKPASSLQPFKVGWASFTEMGILKTFTCCKFLNLLSCKQLSHNTWNGLSSLQNIWNLSLYIEVISGGMPTRGAGVLQYLLTCLRPKQVVNVGLSCDFSLLHLLALAGMSSTSSKSIPSIQGKQSIFQKNHRQPSATSLSCIGSTESFTTERVYNKMFF